MKMTQETSSLIHRAESTDSEFEKLEGLDRSDETIFEPLPLDQGWMPGLIEVVFKDATRSGVRQWNFEEEDLRKEFSTAWPDSLKSVLKSHNLVSWKPSFPLRYPWTSESPEQARESYEKAGRDKFVTLNFPPDAETRRIADTLRDVPAIEQAVAVPRVAPPSGPLDEPLMGTSDQPIDTVCDPSGCLKSQWYIFRCHVNEAWNGNMKVSGKGVTIADIDWGFNLNHQDLKEQITNTKSVLPGASDPHDVGVGGRRAHGTAALGLAGAQVNGRGMAGIAFGAKLWAIQAGTDEIEDHSLWVAALNFATHEPSAGRKIIFLEIQTAHGGNIEMVPTIRTEIMAAINTNVVVCVPAGNISGDASVDDDGYDIPESGSILVGAIRFGLGNILGGSKSGDRVVVYAPGDRTFDLTCSHLGNDRYRNGFGGTSGAVAKVAGAVALMLEANSDLTHEQTREILRQSPTPVFDNSSNRIGSLLNAKHAVCEALKLAGQQC
jgi:hypothetical protein